MMSLLNFLKGQIFITYLFFNLLQHGQLFLWRYTTWTTFIIFKDTATIRSSAIRLAFRTLLLSVSRLHTFSLVFLWLLRFYHLLFVLLLYFIIEVLNLFTQKVFEFFLHIRQQLIMVSTSL
jgi:hypothetical protein